MTVTSKSLIPSRYAQATATNEYSPSGVTAVIDAFTVTNTSASTAQVSVWIVAAGGSADNSSLIVDSRTLGAGQSYSCPETIAHVLEDGESLHILASAVDAITVRMSGREIA